MPRPDPDQQARATVAGTAPEPKPDTRSALVAFDAALADELDRRHAIMATSLAHGIAPDRLKAVALSAFTRTPGLWGCTPVSLARAIVEMGQLGLEPNRLGEAYLVPYRDNRSGVTEAQLIVGYRGLVELARRSGDIARVEARVVHAADTFFYNYGLDADLRHTPAATADPGALTFAYAIAFYRTGEKQFDVMSQPEVEAIRRRSKAKDAGPWVTDYEEMAKKTVLRRLAKLLPLTVEVARGLEEADPEVVEVTTPAAPAGRVAALREQMAAQVARPVGPTAGDGLSAAPEPDVPDTTTPASTPAQARLAAAEAAELDAMGETVSAALAVAAERPVADPALRAEVKAATEPLPSAPSAFREGMARAGGPASPEAVAEIRAAAPPIVTVPGPDGEPVRVDIGTGVILDPDEEGEDIPTAADVAPDPVPVASLEWCDSTSDPKLGPVETCGLPAGHDGVHRAAGGARWPR